MTGTTVVDARVDRFLGGKVALVQPSRGHRAGLDAALLQATLPAAARGSAVDLGTGCGTIAFCLAARAPGLRVTGVDCDSDLLALAGRGLERTENASFRDRVRFVALHVAARREAREAAGLADGTTDFVLMNPPFSAAGAVRASPNPARRRAHVATPDAPLAAWVGTAAALLGQGGRLFMVHRPDALADILAAFTGRFGGAAVLPVHPRAGRPAVRVLIGAVRGSRAPLSIRPGLVLHNHDGSWTDAAARILNGEDHLSMTPAS